MIADVCACVCLPTAKNAATQNICDRLIGGGKTPLSVLAHGIRVKICLHNDSDDVTKITLGGFDCIPALSTVVKDALKQENRMDITLLPIW